MVNRKRKTKHKVTYSLPYEVIRELNMNAREKGLTKSEFLTQILVTIFKTKKSYIEYELLRTGQEHNVWLYRAKNHNMQGDILEILRAGR